MNRIFSRFTFCRENKQTFRVLVCRWSAVGCVAFCLIFALLCSRCSTVTIVGGGAALVGSAAMREKSISETVSDTVLSTRVKAAIYKISPEVHAMVGVNVQESEVLLTGTVPTDEMKTKVERAVWKVSGTKCVYNDIEISDKAPIVNYHKDAWITSQVKAKLLANTKIRSLNYSIKTVNNVVYIFGIARSVDELELVKNIASHVRGALRVMSYVRLKEGAN